MRAAVASIATVCLLTSGCTWMMGRSTRQSRVMDSGFIVSGLIATPAVYCNVSGGNTGEDGCLLSDAGAVLLGIPVLLGFAIAAEAVKDDETPMAPATTGELPAIPTDADTLQLAHQVKAQVSARQCLAARVTMNRIADRDAEYHIAMLARGVLGTCAAGGPGKAQNEPATVAAPAMTPPTAEPLPDVPTDATTLQLAKQVRTAAAAGQCIVVERTMRAIAERDARYHAALAHSKMMEACR